MNHTIGRFLLFEMKLYCIVIKYLTLPKNKLKKNIKSLQVKDMTINEKWVISYSYFLSTQARRVSMLTLCSFGTIWHLTWLLMSVHVCHWNNFSHVNVTIALKQQIAILCGAIINGLNPDCKHPAFQIRTSSMVQSLNRNWILFRIWIIFDFVVHDPCIQL